MQAWHSHKAYNIFVLFLSFGSTELFTIFRLETLELANCQIGRISFSDMNSSPKTNLFPQLKYLDLTNNQVNDWRSVGQLNGLQQLTSLLLKRNPIYDHNKYDFIFNHVISRIARLQTLDREPVSEASIECVLLSLIIFYSFQVTKEKRNDCGKYYLRTIYAEYLTKTEPIQREQFLEENPCFLDLIDKLGEPVIAKKLSKEEKIKQNFLSMPIFLKVD